MPRWFRGASEPAEPAGAIEVSAREIVTLTSLHEGRRIGRALLDAVRDAAVRL